jgi:hypothetical protein
MSTNAYNLICPRCDCKIMQINVGVKTINADMALTPIKNTHTENDKPVEYWTVDNVMAFENVGFTREQDNYKFLICADCDLGPLGFHDTKASKKEYNLACNRVRYQTEDGVFVDYPIAK